MAVIKFNLHFYFPLSTKIIEVSLLIVISEIIKKKNQSYKLTLMTHFLRMLSRRHAHRGEIRLRLIRGLTNYRRGAADVAAVASAPGQPKPHVIVFCGVPRGTSDLIRRRPLINYFTCIDL